MLCFLVSCFMLLSSCCVFVCCCYCTMFALGLLVAAGEGGPTTLQSPTEVPQVEAQKMCTHKNIDQKDRERKLVQEWRFVSVTPCFRMDVTSQRHLSKQWLRASLCLLVVGQHGSKRQSAKTQQKRKMAQKERACGPRK